MPETMLLLLALTASAPPDQADVVPATPLNPPSETLLSGSDDMLGSDQNQRSARRGTKGGRMAWLTIAPKVGYGHYSEGSIDTGLVTTTIGARSTRTLSVDLDIGGSGFGWDLAPYVSLEEGNLTVPDPGPAAYDYAYDEAAQLPESKRVALAQAAQNYARDAAGWTADGKEVTYTSFGVYLGPAVRVPLGRAFYPYFGAGLKAGILTSADIETGVELYGRGVTGLCLYIFEDIGLNVEFGAGYGATGIKGLGAQELSFGPSSTWDLSVGLRFP